MTYQQSYDVEFRTDTSTVAYSMRTNGWTLSDIKFEEPQPQYNFVEVPGRNGALNLSRAVTGSIAFGQGKYTFTFEKDDTQPRSPAAALYNAIHGKSLLIRRVKGDGSTGTYMPNSSTYCEVAITDWEAHPQKSVITVECIYG